MASTPVNGRGWFVPIVALVAIVLASLVVLTLLGSQVSGILSTVGGSVPAGPYDGGTAGDAAGGSDTDGSDTDGSGTAGSGADGVVTAIPREELLIIKTGDLTLEVEGISPAVTAATKQIDALGGYASGSERAGTGHDAQATITFRVPADHWDEAMNVVRGLAVEVLSERSTTEDVTTQVVDLGARVRNLQATEAALQAIMDRATVIKDVLSVQAELSTVRGQIEQLTAQKAHLEEQAAYSTLTATFVLKPTPVLVEQKAQFDPSTEVDHASASLVGILQGLATAGIWFAIVWLPILIALAVIGLIGILIVRRFRRLVPAEPTGN
jgi:Domain of unknown function (DUF4349)